MWQKLPVCRAASASFSGGVGQQQKARAFRSSPTHDLFVLSASPKSALSLYLALSLLLSLSGLTHPMAAMFIYKKFTVIYEHSHKESFGLGK